MKPTVPEVMPLVREYYEDNYAGGSLHIVLDDGNIRDSDLEFCLKEAELAGDERAIKIAKLMLQMSKTQRKKLSRG